MHEAAGQPAVHHHAPPQGFIRKNVFSLDHKMIGLQYFGLALAAVFTGMVLSWLMRIHLGWPMAAPFRGWISFRQRRARWRDHARNIILSLMTMHGTIMVFLRIDQRPVAAFWELLPADSDRRGRHGVSAFQYDVVLGHPRRISCPGFGFLCAGWPADFRLDRLCASERRRRRRGSRSGTRPDAVGRFPLAFFASASCSAR